MKLTKRKGFNFFRSYFDVYNELNDKDKVKFMDALLDRQFLGVKPVQLSGMAKFAYISQTNSIDSQVKGYQDKTGNILTNDPTVGGTVGGEQGATVGGNLPPTQQVEGKGKVEGKEKEEDKYNTPTLEVFKAYALSKEPNVDQVAVGLKYEAWKENNWLDGNDKQIKNWKTKLLNTLPHLPKKKSEVRKINL